MMTSTEALSPEAEKEYQILKRKKVAKPLLWFGMVSIVMLFAGLTSAVIVRKGDGNWNAYELPEFFLYSTIALLISSITIAVALMAAKRDNQKLVKAGLAVTMILGVSFIFLQLEGFNEMVANGIFFTGAEQNASGSFVYIISGLHIAHLIGGIVALSITLFNGFREKYKPKNLLGLQLCSIYWHFMDAIWIYLYIFFTLVI